MIEDSVLVAQLKNPKTQERAFRTLMSQYKERLYWHIRRIVLSHENADDVLQNTFIKVFRSINNFNEQSKLYSWMYRIATNESITFINKEAKKKNVTISEVQHQMVGALNNDIHYTGNEIQQLLQRAIVSLPEKQQLVFNMKYYDEMKYQDISDVLGTSVGALKASYFHAVKKIETFVKANQ